DLTGIDFVTIDPAESRDLDQAVCIETNGAGFRVWYAIADTGAWVRPGGAMDSEARRRGQTTYAPNVRLPLYPRPLSEGAASLLADGQERPANVWRVDLDADGAVENAEVIRARVRSRAKLSYEQVQRDLDAERADESLRLLRSVGRLRIAQEAARGGASLNLPEQSVTTTGDKWALVYRQLLPVEGWNAQISLLAGMVAAEMMLNAGVGVLRTMPAAPQAASDDLRHTALELRLPWPDGMNYGDFVRSLDPTTPVGLAMMNACTALFRGAGYTVIAPDMPPEEYAHGAVAAPYAHVTAPLRRLVDRFTGAICAALSAGEPVPEWVRAALPELPQIMAETDHREKSFERGIISLTEALTLSARRGEVLEGTVIMVNAHDDDRGAVAVPDLAIEAPVAGDDLKLGEQVKVRVADVDVDMGRVLFSITPRSLPDGQRP
ncbi:MAG: RNB domain-containing ribonuclease, partial [Propionibacteriaceae bacterium]|nr:RNB domain-containing ribonuclease [Propionibacteriaceae bacterium]